MKKEWENMLFTGERFVPNVHGNIELEHLHRYLEACELAAGKVVLDIASGEGYGSAMLANKANKVIGVDISAEAIKHARKCYQKENLEYMVGSCADIPLPDASVDIVVSFETIEHHDQHEQMMQEIKRVLRPDGILLISSPDKYHYSVESGYNNPYHVKELYQHEFKQFLGNYFKNTAYFGQRIIYGSGIFAESLATPTLSYWQENEFIKEALGLAKPVYWIALASDVQLPQLSSGVFEHPIEDSEIVQSWKMVAAERDEQITSLSDMVVERGKQIANLSDTLVERDGQIASLSDMVVERGKQIANLSDTLVERDGQIASLSDMVIERGKQIANLSDTLVERDGQIASLSDMLVERDGQIASLSDMVAERDGQIASLSDMVAERDRQIASLNQLAAQREALLEIIETMHNSQSWRITRPLRFTVRLLRYGLIDDDRRSLTRVMQTIYTRLPLPLFMKRILKRLYNKAFGNSYHDVHRTFPATTQAQPPQINQVAEQTDAPDYIVWGVIDWHFRHQRPQHLAEAIAASGRRVFYVSANLIDNGQPGFDLEPLDTSGRLFQIKLFAKGAPVIYSSAPGIETVEQLRSSIGSVLAWANTRGIISLVQHPFWYDIASMLPNCRVVYDCMDHHEGFGNTAEEVLSLERALMRDADLTVTSSALLDQIVSVHTQSRALIRNAGEFEHFAHKPDKIYVEPQGRRIIGYYGAIAEWFDQDLVEAVAKQNPDCCVLLIGADTVNCKSKLGKLSNVLFTGEVPYSKLPFYLYSFDVCLLPFKVIPLTLATNPVKAYEYLSAGKPVVTVDLPEMVQFDGLVYVSANQEQFLAAITTILAQPEPEDMIQCRKTFAAGQTWSHRGEMLIEQAESTANDPMVSVVVVTYNNLELTRACLASLEDHSDYANLEIIIVDNASGDGSREFLEEWAAKGHNRKLILNDDNRGFAAANNQGLAVASGDYLVLLNNDTFVTPGWIRTLLKHLQLDKSIGLIGPVTNNIGNEAKINIAYGDMTEMLAASADYTRKHIGQTFPLHTAAFFCVMMRRDVYERVGTLDETFGRGFFEDDDYCRRIEQIGLRIVCAEDVFIHHHLSASFNKLRSAERQALFEQNKATYESKWGEWTPHVYREPNL